MYYYNSEHGYIVLKDTYTICYHDIYTLYNHLYIRLIVVWYSIITNNTTEQIYPKWT